MVDTPAAVLGVSQSVAGQKWTARCETPDVAKAIAAKTGVSHIVADLLCGRGVGPEDAEVFLDPTLRNSMPDPSSFADMDKAAGLILDAMARGDKITVFADYDVDGGTSAAQLIRFGRAMGHTFGLYVPDRVEEGYGPSANAFQAIKENGTQLVITVDCGAAATTALEAAAQIGLPVIVIDHHLMGADLPPCAALVNPNRADDVSGQGHMAAAGVTFMLLAALSREAKRRGMAGVPNIINYLDLTAMGTICDVVALKGVNRAIVRQGLKVLSARVNPGLTALADVAGASGELGTYHAGFILGPRINAGGRIGRADMGAAMLSSDDPTLVTQSAQTLDEVNQQRKALQADILMEAKARAAKLPQNHAVTIVSMEGWHPGIIGIVAGRLKDTYGRPCIVIGVNEEGIGKGSGRSIKGVNLGGAIAMAKRAGILTSGGGHEMAGGLTIDAAKIPAFETFINAHLADEVRAARAAQSLKIDAVITPGAAKIELLDEIAIVGPFGAGNPQPVFAFEKLRIAYAERTRGGFVRVDFEDAAGSRIKGIAFKAAETGMDDVLLSGAVPFVHVAGTLKRNEWKGRVSVDLHILDIAPAK